MPLEEFLLLFLMCSCVAMKHTPARCLTLKLCQSLKCASLGEPSAFYHSMSWQKETYRVKIPKQQLTTNTFPWKHPALMDVSVVQSFSGCESHSHVFMMQYNHHDTNTMDLLTQIQPQSQDGTNRLKRASVKGKLVCFQLQKLSWSCEYTTNLHLLSSLPTETLRKANRWIWSS